MMWFLGMPSFKLLQEAGMWPWRGQTGYCCARKGALWRNDACEFSNNWTSILVRWLIIACGLSLSKQHTADCNFSCPCRYQVCWLTTVSCWPSSLDRYEQKLLTIACHNYIANSRKYAPIFAHYYEAEVGRGCLLKDSYFWKNGLQLHQTSTTEISGTCCVDSKVKRHESNLYYNTLLLSVIPRPNLEKQKEGLVL